jgi:predicted acyl esterase
MHGTSVILWIERGAGAEEESDGIFRSLLEHRQEIEDSFGAPLDWEAKESNRSRKVRFGLDGGGWSDMEQWPEAVDVTVDAMLRLDRAVSPHLPSAMKSIDRIVGPRPSGDRVP